MRKTSWFKAPFLFNHPTEFFSPVDFSHQELFTDNIQRTVSVHKRLAKETGFARHPSSAIEPNYTIVWEVICLCFHLTWIYCVRNHRLQSVATTNLSVAIAKTVWTLSEMSTDIAFLPLKVTFVRQNTTTMQYFWAHWHSLVDSYPIQWCCKSKYIAMPSWRVMFECFSLDVRQFSAADLSTGTASLVGVTKSDSPLSPK